jgi:molecular chaperone HtpG
LANLNTADPASPLVVLLVEQLLDSALVQEGLHPNPADMLPRIQALMEQVASKK